MSDRKRSPARQGIAQRTDAKGRTQYRGTAYDKRAKRHLRGPWTPNLAEARSWRVDAVAGIQAGRLSAAAGPTITEAIDQFLPGIERGSIRNRSGRAYKPSAIRGYKRDLLNRVGPTFGGVRIARLTRVDVQRWADDVAAEGLQPQTVRNIVTSLRALYAWALYRGMASVNPCTGVRLPAGGRRRDRVADPGDVPKLINTLALGDRAAFGLAVYAGLRLGEILALDWSAVDLDAHTIDVRRNWDHGARRIEQNFGEAKTGAGHRSVFIVDPLASLLNQHRGLTGGTGLLFPDVDDRSRPVSAGILTRRINRFWREANPPLDGLTMHEARHTAASMFIHAGLNAKTVSTFMGHANISVTLDRYGHLFPGAKRRHACC